jgi:hypothetical protein
MGCRGSLSAWASGLPLYAAPLEPRENLCPIHGDTDEKSDNEPAGADHICHTAGVIALRNKLVHDRARGSHLFLDMGGQGDFFAV